MQVVAIYRYPVKSCAAIPLDSCLANLEGLEGDRRFQLIFDNGRFVSQREVADLALIQAQLLDDYLQLSYKDQCWQFSLNDFSAEKPVSIWNDQVLAEIYQGPENALLSQQLGVSVTLARLPLQARPISDPSTDGFVSFADALPYLITNNQSLQDLNQRLTEAVTMDHFRPNIVVDGDYPYQEDDWQKLMIGDLTFRAVKPCSRCVITTINQRTAEKNPQAEPLKTLATYRMKEAGKIIFGMNMIVEQAGMIRVGDKVRVL